MSTMLTLLPFSSTRPDANYAFEVLNLEAGGEAFEAVDALQATAGVPVPDDFTAHVGDEWGNKVTGSWGQRLRTLTAGQLCDVLMASDNPDAWHWNATVAYLLVLPANLRVCIHFH